MPKQYGFAIGEQAEIKDLYDGSYQSIKELAKLFKCSTTKMRWFLNYKNYKNTHKTICKKWYEANKERANKYCRDYYYAKRKL